LTLDGKGAEDDVTRPAHGDDPLAACDRLITLLERAIGLESVHASARDDTIQEPMTRYIVAQLRMRIRPALVPGWPAHDPVHVALFGGTHRALQPVSGGVPPWCTRGPMADQCAIALSRLSLLSR
jgi:hypothetical protein